MDVSDIDVVFGEFPIYDASVFSDYHLCMYYYNVYCLYEMRKTPAAADAEQRTLKAQVHRQQKKQKQSRNSRPSNALPSQTVVKADTVQLPGTVCQKSEFFHHISHFYCAMHFSAKRGIAMVILSLCLSVTFVIPDQIG